MNEGSGPGSPEIIDLNARLADLGISYEPPEQMRQRLERERLQLEHQLEQERLDKQHQRDTELQETMHQRRIFWFVFVVVIATGAISLWVGLFAGTTSPDAQVWARTTASAIVAGIVGDFSGARLGPR